VPNAEMLSAYAPKEAGEEADDLAA
jgi:hypothetical protein